MASRPRRLRTWLALLLFLSLLSAACTQEGTEPTSAPSPTATVAQALPTPTPPAIALTTPTPTAFTVRLRPSMGAVPRGAVITVEVRGFPLERGVSAGEITIQVDPAAVELRDISPGDLLGPSPLVGLRRTDSNTGAAFLALARVGPTQPPTPSGLFAILTLRIRDSAPAGTLPLTATVRFLDERFTDIAPVELLVEPLVVQTP